MLLKMHIKTTFNYSPNFSTYRRNPKNIKYIIYHYTGMSSESKAINRLTDVKSKVSCHYFIKRNGFIISMVPDLHESWHAGKSNWKNYTSRTVILFVSVVVGILNVAINSGIYLQKGLYVLLSNWDIVIFSFFGGLGNIIIVSALHFS